MKKNLYISFALLLGANLVNAAVPYYMTNPDNSKIDAIKTDKACADCGDCNGDKIVNPFQKQEIINLNDAQAQELAKTVAAVIANKQA